jgi:sporulation protein YlmC with PRC-barrel domain
MKRYGAILVLALLVGATGQADAKRYVLKEDEPLVFGSMVEALPQLNRLKPLQNPRMVKSDSVLGGTVSDSQNKIVGSVEDITVNADGSLAALEINFDRLRLQEPVYLSSAATKIIASSNGYKIGLVGADIAAQYPQLLAEIETASGDGSIPSVKSMIGASVMDENNAKIGEIADILMNEERTRIDALYVMVDAVRDHGVAVPFAFIGFDESNGIIRARMSNDDRDAVLRYLND